MIPFVPEGSGREIEANAKSERASEDGRDEDAVPPGKCVIESVGELENEVRMRYYTGGGETLTAIMELRGAGWPFDRCRVT